MIFLPWCSFDYTVMNNLVFSLVSVVPCSWLLWPWAGFRISSGQRGLCAWCRRTDRRRTMRSPLCSRSLPPRYCYPKMIPRTSQHVPQTPPPSPSWQMGHQRKLWIRYRFPKRTASGTAALLLRPLVVVICGTTQGWEGGHSCRGGLLLIRQIICLWMAVYPVLGTVGKLRWYICKQWRERTLRMGIHPHQTKSLPVSVWLWSPTVRVTAPLCPHLWVQTAHWVQAVTTAAPRPPAVPSGPRLLHQPPPPTPPLSPHKPTPYTVVLAPLETHLCSNSAHSPWAPCAVVILAVVGRTPLIPRPASTCPQVAPVAVRTDCWSNQPSKLPRDPLWQIWHQGEGKSKNLFFSLQSWWPLDTECSPHY